MSETKSKLGNAPEKELPERTRIPMSVPHLKLDVPEIEGYHCHWFRGKDGRIEAALKAGYEFVQQEEVKLNDFGIGNGEEFDGHSDLGTRVSRPTGESGDRLYLMKLRNEWWEEDQRALAQINEDTAKAIRGARDVGDASPYQQEKNRTYSRGESAPAFTPLRRRP